MRKFPKTIISKFLLICGFVLIISAPFYNNFLNFIQNGTFTKRIATNEFSQLISPLTKMILKRWRLGDLEQTYQTKGFNCPKLIANNLNLEGEFFKCNFLYFECFLEGHAGVDPKFILGPEGQSTFKAIRNNDGKFISLNKKGNVFFSLRLEGSQNLVQMELKDSCRSNYLPAKVYSSGMVGVKDKVFDTIGQNIYIDKNYISYKDKYQYDISLNNKWDIIQPELVASAFTKINFEERKNLCHFRGGKLLKSRLLDAASFFPFNNTAGQNYYYKYPYHWQKGKTGSFLYEAKVNSRFSLKKEDCDRAYVKGCENITPYVSDNTHSISWIGLHAPLGAYPESVENDFLPKENLKVSSFYLSSFSSWHEVGKRGRWSGEGFEREDFDLSSLESYFEVPSPYEVAFRCYYEGDR